jgi:transcriptional regulator with XRE-family HTH domain
MKEGFTRKKVESLTLGEKLKKLRGDFRMSLAEISKATKIQAKYLEYLEEGQYEKLPAEVYVRGFLRSYARCLNVDELVLIKLYERERNIHTNLGRNISKKTFNYNKFYISSFVVTPRSLAIVMIFLLVGGSFFYLIREFRSFASAPRLVVLSPDDGAIIEASEITVNGKTDNDARVSINNQPVFVGSGGEFSNKLILQPGLNKVTVVAINRFDKEKSETFFVEARYTPATPATGTEEAGGTKSQETFYLDVSIRDLPTKIALEADGAVVFSGILKPGESQKAEAKEKIKVVSENAARTFVRFNGQEELPLSDKQMMREVIFTSAGKEE